MTIRVSLIIKIALSLYKYYSFFVTTVHLGQISPRSAPWFPKGYAAQETIIE